MSKFKLLIYYLLFAPVILQAQIFSNPDVQAFNAEGDFDYINYWAVPLNNSTHHPPDDFTPLTISTKPVILRIPSNFTDSSKVYRITDSEGYEFRYPGSELMVKSKQGFKPITMRTFFLEASRQGIIPPETKYKEFTQLSLDDKRALLDDTGNELHQNENYEYENATLSYQVCEDGLKIFVESDVLQLELVSSDSKVGEGKRVGVKFLPLNHTPTCLVKMLIDPRNNYQLPGNSYYENFNSVFRDVSAKMFTY